MTLSAWVKKTAEKVPRTKFELMFFGGSSTPGFQQRRG